MNELRDGCKDGWKFKQTRGTRVLSLSTTFAELKQFKY
jgi:hypothetical protein